MSVYKCESHLRITRWFVGASLSVRQGYPSEREYKASTSWFFHLVVCFAITAKPIAFPWKFCSSICMQNILSGRIPGFNLFSQRCPIFFSHAFLPKHHHSHLSIGPWDFTGLTVYHISLHLFPCYKRQLNIFFPWRLLRCVWTFESLLGKENVSKPSYCSPLRMLNLSTEILHLICLTEKLFSEKTD